jgi:alkylation response protein AidB-like acyl-CoA dehydrogenase
MPTRRRPLADGVSITMRGWPRRGGAGRPPGPAAATSQKGNGDLLINRNFAWSGPVAGIAAVGVARVAAEAALSWAKTYTAGGPHPIIHHQYVGYVLGETITTVS